MNGAREFPSSSLHFVDEVQRILGAPHDFVVGVARILAPISDFVVRLNGIRALPTISGRLFPEPLGPISDFVARLNGI